MRSEQKNRLAGRALESLAGRLFGAFLVSAIFVGALSNAALSATMNYLGTW